MGEGHDFGRAMGQMRRLAVGAMVALGAAAPAMAQEGDLRTAITVNPFAVLSSDFVAEGERAAGARHGLGMAVNRSTSHSENDSAVEENDRRWRSVDLLARRYRGGRALDGFSVGATAGRMWITRTRTLNFGAGSDSETFSAAQWTLGLRVDYSRAYRRRLHAGVGVGLKAGLLRTGDFDAEMPYAIPSLRVVLGVRF